MKVEVHNNILTGKNIANAAPTRVCMHVLGVARDDVRAMRAATSLTNAGFDVSIIDIASESVLATEEDINGIHVRHMRVSQAFFATRFRQWAFLRAIWLFIRNILWLTRAPADIYHALDLPALPACYVAARLRHKPLIFEAYELPFSTLAMSDMTIGRRLLQKCLIPLINHIVPHCAGVIAVSPPIVEEMQKRYRIPNVSLVRNILPYQTVVKSDRLRQRLRLRPDAHIALYQGYLQSDRGLDRLIRAARFLDQNAVIVIMGKDRDATQAQLEALIAREGVADRVKIIPPIPYSELLDWTASADIGLMIYPPDYSLNVQMMLPNKLFEFLMAGLPVLSSQLDAVIEITRTYEIGQVVTSLAPIDISIAINAMLTNQNALAYMRHNALTVAQREFNWEKEQQELLCLYQKVRQAFLEM